MSHRDLRKEIEAGTSTGLYIFYGEETYLRDYYLAEMRKKYVAEDFEAFNYSVFDKTVGAAELTDAVDSFPVFADKKMIVLHDLDLFKPPAELRDSLEKIVADVPDHCILVFFYDTIAFAPDKRTKLFSAFKEKGKAINFETPKKEELMPWIRRCFRALGKDINNEMCEYLVFLCGTSMTSLTGEISKIAAYATIETIKREHIDAVAIPVTDAVVYDLTDAIAEKNYKKAMEVYQRLKQTGEEDVALVALMAKQLRQTYTAKLSGSTQKLSAMWGMRSSFQADRIMRTAKRSDLASLRHAVTLCAQADADIKGYSGASMQDDAVKLLLANLAAGGKK